MAENTNPQTTGYTAEGRAVEAQAVDGEGAMDIPHEPVKSLADDEAAGFALQAQTLSTGEPAVVPGEPEAAAAGDPDEMLGEVLQSQELNPAEPAVTNDPMPLEGTATPTCTAAPGYTAEGRQLEQEAVTPGAPTSFPSEPVAPYGAAQTAAPMPPHAAAQQAYQATYGAPVNQAPQGWAAPSASAPAGAYQRPATGAPTQPTPVANPHAAATAAAYQKTRGSVDIRRVFLICGLVVGALMVLFGLCMLAFHTPNAGAQAMDAFQLGQEYYNATGATSQEILKTGFCLLLIGLGGADICAFGAKLFEKKSVDAQ